MTVIDPRELPQEALAQLFLGLVAPRPIAWVSTLDECGERNLAPFSYFNAFSTAPPTLAIGPGSRSGVEKDSLANIRRTGEFVVNVVTESLARLANLTAGEFAADVDEWEVAALEAAPSEDVRPPRVAASPAAFECRVFQIVELGEPEAPTNSIVIAHVTRVHVADEVLDGLVPRPDALALVGRLGGNLWCTTRDRFELRRPESRDPDEARRAFAETRGRPLVSEGTEEPE